MTAYDNNIINLIRTRIRKKEPSAEVILFGSKARGKAHSESDWDILILLNVPTVSLEEEKGFREEIFDIELETGEPISTFVFSKQEWETKHIYTPFYANIKREGKIIV